MTSFYQLFLANLKMLYRNKSGLFLNAALPVGIYCALSLLPIPSLSGQIIYKNYILPGIIAYTIMTNGIYGLAYWMTEMKARGVIKRLMATPLKGTRLMLSLLASRLFIIYLQVILLTLIGIIFFHAKFMGNIFTIFVLTTIGGGIFLLLGLIISSFATSYETAAPLTAAMAVPMIFFGNIFFPAGNLPGMLKTISRILPVSYLADGLRRTYLRASGLPTLSRDLLILLIWLLLALLITKKVFKLKE